MSIVFRNKEYKLSIKEHSMFNDMIKNGKHTGDALQIVIYRRRFGGAEK